MRRVKREGGVREGEVGEGGQQMPLDEGHSDGDVATVLDSYL